jgi:hypothetical protein
MVTFSDLAYPSNFASIYLEESGFCAELQRRWNDGILSIEDLTIIENDFRTALDNAGRRGGSVWRVQIQVASYVSQVYLY